MYREKAFVVNAARLPMIRNARISPIQPSKAKPGVPLALTKTKVAEDFADVQRECPVEVWINPRL